MKAERKRKERPPLASDELLAVLLNRHLSSLFAEGGATGLDTATRTFDSRPSERSHDLSFLARGADVFVVFFVSGQVILLLLIPVAVRTGLWLVGLLDSRWSYAKFSMTHSTSPDVAGVVESLLRQELLGSSLAV